MKVDCVVDSSALVEVVAGNAVDPGLLRRMGTITGASPELLDAEALSALRQMVLRGALTDARADRALRTAHGAPIARMPHRPLLHRAWEIRHAVAAFDAFYVALAERLDVPLVTCDARLAGSNGHDARIELYPRP